MQRRTGIKGQTTCKVNCIFIHQIKAFDVHLNLLLSDVEEKITIEELDEKTNKETVKVLTKNFGLIYVRGDLVIMISPPNKNY